MKLFNFFSKKDEIILFHFKLFEVVFQELLKVARRNFSYWTFFVVDIMRPKTLDSFMPASLFGGNQATTSYDTI
ncbi:MAG: hypothetical protein A2231_01870 [Candidatus Firestonebacteria bacterium RIFOXYA2_FULL_40_8]|nr:MAG: hypothetical protein A2231_01870 [Candidatus Firestonebacteria bacterium RIFOXYA2_FULL_40_8]